MLRAARHRPSCACSAPEDARCVFRPCVCNVVCSAPEDDAPADALRGRSASRLARRCMMHEGCVLLILACIARLQRIMAHDDDALRGRAQRRAPRLTPPSHRLYTAFTPPLHHLHTVFTPCCGHALPCAAIARGRDGGAGGGGGGGGGPARDGGGDGGASSAALCCCPAASAFTP